MHGSEGEKHTLSDHKGKYNPSHLSTLAKVASRPALRPFDKCPLCKIDVDDVYSNEGHHQLASGPDRLARHAAGHLKSLALMFLPPGVDDMEDETDSENSSSHERSRRNVDSKDSIFEAPLTVEGDDHATLELASDFKGEDADWPLMSKTQEFNPEVDPTLQSFVKRAQPQQRQRDPRHMIEDWARFYKLTSKDVEGVLKKEIHRQNILHEIVQSEYIYLQELDFLRKFYGDHLQKSPNRFSKSMKSVCAGIDDLKLLNEVYLLQPLYQKQDLEGPWITGFSEIFRRWLAAARQPYKDYATGYLYANYLGWLEANRNPLFKLKLDLAGGFLDLNINLKTPLMRVQRYYFLLDTVQKNSQHIKEEREKTKLSTVIVDLKSFALELDGVVDENNKTVELIRSQIKLYLRPGLEDKVKLDLNHLGREVILRRDLLRAGTNRFTWLDTDVTIFYQYLVLAKKVVQKDSAVGQRREVHYVSRLPILIPLLVLLEDDTPMVAKSSFRAGAATTPTATAKGPKYATSDSISLDNITTIPDPPDTLYPFSIRYLGRLEKYTLYAPTANNRREWCDKIREAQDHYAVALASRNSNPFRLKVLVNFSLTLTREWTGKQLTGRIRATPLDHAIEESSETHYGNSLGTNIVCVDTYGPILVVGNGNGIYTLGEPENGIRKCTLCVEMAHVTQIAVFPEYQLCLFVGKKSLWAIPLDSFTDPRPGHYFIPRKISGVQEVKSFATFQSTGTFMVFYRQPPPLPLQPSSLKVLEVIPAYKASWKLKSPSAFNILSGENTNISVLFRDLGSVDCHKDFTNISILRPSNTSPFVALCNSAGFTNIRIKEPPIFIDSEYINRVSEAEPHVALSTEPDTKGISPLGMFLLTTNWYLLCYPACAIYVDMDGGLKIDHAVHFLGPAKLCRNVQQVYRTLPSRHRGNQERRRRGA